MDNKILEIHQKLAKQEVPQLKAGMTVKVWYKIKEKDRFRTTFFEGIIISVKHGLKTLNSTFTVRKIASNNIGVEMTWPIHSPLIEKIEIKNNPKTRRNKLYYLREKSRREIKAKLKKVNLEQKANNNLEEAVNIDNSLESQNQE